MTTCENHSYTVVCFHSPQQECPLCRAEKDLDDAARKIEELEVSISNLQDENDKLKNQIDSDKDEI